MQVFANGKRCFHSFIAFYAIHLKNQEVKIQSSTLNNESDQDGEAEHKLFCCLVLFWGFDEQ